MRSITAMLAFILALCTAPAHGANRLQHIASYDAQPRAIIAIPMTKKRVEMVAVSKRARADTPMRRAHLGNCENMAKVYPGYPQPAFISVDFRLKF